MPDFRRYFVPGGMYFFTVVTARRAPLFRNPEARRLLGVVTRRTQVKSPFEIVAIVLLPDHLHAIWSLPPGDADYPNRWKSIKAGFTVEWIALGHREQRTTKGYTQQRRRGIWQPRYFEHTIRDEADLSQHMDYIHYNPVKHGYANCPGDWKWSSFHRYVKAGDYPANWGRAEHPKPVFESLNEDLLE